MRRRKYFVAVCSAVFAAFVFIGALTLRAEDQGNVLVRKQRQATQYHEPEQKAGRLFDDTLRIYLDSPKTSYTPGTMPTITVYIKNESKKTRFFKRVWSPTGAEGVAFNIFFDGKESWGSGMFKREAVVPESPDPAKALRLDPGERAPVFQIKFTKLAEGSHVINAQYEAKYIVTEKQQRNWWQGLSRSNTLTLKVSRSLPQKEVNQALDSVINAINKDLLALKVMYPEMADYGADDMTRPKGAFGGASVIDYRKPKPSKFRINIYFNRPDFEPNMLATLNDGFPFLDTSLFAHIEVGKNTQLREEVIGVVKKRDRALNDVMRKFENYLSVDIQPFESNVEDQFARAPNIILGTVISAEVEKNKAYDYQLKKWILKVKVNEVYRGKVAGGTIKAKCGTLNLVFNDEKVEGRQFIIMLLDKESWQPEYNVVGAQAPRDNLLSWLRKKYSKK